MKKKPRKRYPFKIPVYKSPKSIEEKIKKLKEEARGIKTNRIRDLYSLFSKIVNLRKKHNQNYTFRSLEWEKDLDIKGGSIRYIQSYEYFSNYAKSLIKKGIINDTKVAFTIYKYKILRTPKYQKIMLDKLIKKEISISSLGELNQDEIYLFLYNKLKVRVDTNYLKSATKTLRAMLSRLKARDNLLKKGELFFIPLLSASENLYSCLKSKELEKKPKKKSK